MKINKKSSSSSGGLSAGQTGASGKSPARPGDSEVSSAEEIKHSPFLDELAAANIEGVRRELNDILEEIEVYGADLKKAASIETFQKYKGLVQMFMQEVQEKIYEVKEIPSRYWNDNQKVFVTVQKLNDALDEFTRQFMEKQVDRLSLVKKVDEIRGLLLDLMI